ncbi:hypothetical protein [Vibrio kanaloae]|uniref:hypothetical protein n=1 Tax=Vibrio kanaloae TaxID=170673 RepID=UPI001482371F|nr:hypothetical protein [Vibrio kanaloae]
MRGIELLKMDVDDLASKLAKTSHDEPAECGDLQTLLQYVRYLEQKLEDRE